jgi:hypothetical protein
MQQAVAMATMQNFDIMSYKFKVYETLPLLMK